MKGRAWRGEEGREGEHTGTGNLNSPSSSPSFPLVVYPPSFPFLNLPSHPSDHYGDEDNEEESKEGMDDGDSSS